MVVESTLVRTLVRVQVYKCTLVRTDVCDVWREIRNENFFRKLNLALPCFHITPIQKGVKCIPGSSLPLTTADFHQRNLKKQILKVFGGSQHQIRFYLATLKQRNLCSCGKFIKKGGKINQCTGCGLTVSVNQISV